MCDPQQGLHKNPTTSSSKSGAEFVLFQLYDLQQTLSLSLSTIPMSAAIFYRHLMALVCLTSQDLRSNLNFIFIASFTGFPGSPCRDSTAMYLAQKLLNAAGDFPTHVSFVTLISETLDKKSGLLRTWGELWYCKVTFAGALILFAF